MISQPVIIFKAGKYFKAGDDFKAGKYFTAGDNFEITNHIIFPNYYKYIGRMYYEINSKKWFFQFGCFLRTADEWEADFWNNNNEFPNDDSEESNKRLKLFHLMKDIIKLNGTTNQQTKQFY